MWLRQFVASWARLRKNPVWHWCALFVVLSVTVDNHLNNANPYARFATLQAVAEEHRLAIDRYVNTTCDWAQPPDGHYYSNKAPGPTLLAIPFYLPVDAIVVAHAGDRMERDIRRSEARDALLSYLAIVLQAIPFALVVLLAAEALERRGASRTAILLAALAMLFGNTASLLMNVFFGHGMAAMLTLALALALLERRWALAGLLFGLDVLADYGSALLLPVLVSLLVFLGAIDWRARAQRLVRFALGGLGPLVAFAAYHSICFGGPFTLPNKYQNPDLAAYGERALFGVIDLVPSWHVVESLLFAPARSLAYTQPWILFLIPILGMLVWERRRWGERLSAVRTVACLSVGGLALLLLMNASFAGWDGGVSPGPRYLSAVFPVFGLALGLAYDKLARPLRILLWVALLPSLAMFVLIWAGDPAVWPNQDIWDRCLDVLFRFGLVSSYLRLTWILFGFAVATAIAVARARLAARRR